MRYRACITTIMLVGPGISLAQPLSPAVDLGVLLLPMAIGSTSSIASNFRPGGEVVFPDRAEGFEGSERGSRFLGPAPFPNYIRMTAEGNVYARSSVSTLASGLAASARSHALVAERVLEVAASSQRLRTSSVSTSQFSVASAGAYLLEDWAVRIPFNLTQPVALTVSVDLEGRVSEGSLSASLTVLTLGNVIYNQKRYDAFSSETRVVVERLDHMWTFDAPPAGCVSVESPECIFTFGLGLGLEALSANGDAVLSGLRFGVPEGFDVFSARGLWPSGDQMAVIPITGTPAFFLGGLAILGLGGRKPALRREQFHHH